jgi:ubiquinone/menaquinone biosynthesis C-methylase UbiE
VGRFATTVPYYSRYREPYPQAFFETVSKRLNLSARERLADIGCGPAPLALGFARYVASCVGIDPEPAMLAEARQQASQAGITLKLVQARIEQLPQSLGPFDIVTIGRALHWMEPEATSRVLDRIVAGGGSIVICGSSPAPGASNPWLEPYDEVRHRWADHCGEERYSADPEQRFAGVRFRFIERVVVTTIQWVTPEELVRRSLSRSTSSPQVLGERLAEFEREIVEAVRPFILNGAVREEIHAIARIFR